ncbi:MAG: tetratricopeptide repeat protein, partial [Myxococcales bacterium]|nr:tetratricopeptide repeat protein [Myxococcales bacterium]
MGLSWARARRWAVALLILVGLWLAGLGPAAAIDPAEAFKQGLELFQKKRFDEALPLFEEAVADSGSPNARIYVARCLRELGRLDAAYEEMRLTVRDATRKAETEPKYEPTRDSAASELALLEPRVGRLVVTVVEPPEGTVVYVGGRELSVDQLGVPVAAMPGRVDVRAEALGFKPVERTADIEAGSTRTMTITFDEALPVDGERPGPGDEDVPTTGGEVRIAGYAVGAVGLVGVVVGAVLAGKAQADFDALTEECGGPCPASEQTRIDDGRSLTLGANIGLIGGSIVTAAGIAMIIFGGPDELEASSEALFR